MTTISVSKRGKADKVFHLGNSEVMIKNFEHFVFMIDGTLFTLFFDKKERQFEIRKGSKVLLSYRIPPEVRFSPVVVDPSEVALSCNHEADFGDNLRCPCCDHSAPYGEFKKEERYRCPRCGTMALSPTQIVKYAFKHAVLQKGPQGGGPNHKTTPEEAEELRKFIPNRCQVKK